MKKTGFSRAFLFGVIAFGVASGFSATRAEAYNCGVAHFSTIKTDTVPQNYCGNCTIAPIPDSQDDPTTNPDEIACEKFVQCKIYSVNCGNNPNSADCAKATASPCPCNPGGPSCPDPVAAAALNNSTGGQSGGSGGPSGTGN